MRRTLSVALVGLFLVGCFPNVKYGALDGEQHEIARTYSADFDRAWEATVRVLQRYPVITIEKASGLLITDWVDGTSDVYYSEFVGQRTMLPDRTRLNVKVSTAPGGGTHVTVNQYVKIQVATPGVVSPGFFPPGPALPTVTVQWVDASAVKDLPVRTSSKREKDILDAIGTALALP